MLIIHHPHFVYNKYYYWYINLISKFLDTIPEGMYESHHILPKSMGGSNDSTNLVRLPVRYHYIAHLLLWKSTKGKSHQKMAYAVTTMKIGRVVKTNSRLYESAKKIARLYKSKNRQGMFVAIDTDGSTRLINNKDPRYLSGELVSASKGRLLGRSQTNQHKLNLAKSKLAKLNPNHKWIVTTPFGIFQSLGEAANAHNTSRTTVLNRCNSVKFPEWIKASCTSVGTPDESQS